MEKMEGKYFEHTINKLSEAKMLERIEMRPEFRVNLRAGLMERAMNIPMKMDWSDLVLRWKYVFGAVPALAVLTIVVVNMSNLQVKMPTSEIIPRSVDSTVMNKNLSNVLVNDNSILSNSLVNGENTLVTFSADSVMPPADVLAAARAGERSGVEVNGFSDNAIQQVENSDSTMPLSFMNDMNENIKLNPPTVDLFSFDKVDSKVNSAVIIPTKIQTAPIFVGPSVVMFPIDITPTPAVNNSLRPEINQKVEGLQKVEVVPTAVEQNFTAPIQVVQPELKVVQPVTPTVTPTITPDPAAKIQAPLVSPDVVMKVQAPVTNYEFNNQNVEPMLNEVYVYPVDEAKVLATGVNSVDVSKAMQGFASPTILETSRIIYEGADKPLVNALVLKALADRNGNLSSDYYVNVLKLENGKLKISLFEYGKVKEIVYMESNLVGEYRVVTVINY